MQSAFYRGEPTRAGEQFEQDRDQHRRDERPEQHRRPGQRLRAALDEAGGMFVKLGQVLSTRADLLPADVRSSPRCSAP